MLKSIYLDNKVTYSMVDANLNLSTPSLMTTIEDSVTYFFNENKLGTEEIYDKLKASFVVLRTKVIKKNFLHINDSFKLKVSAVKVSLMSMIVKVEILKDELVCYEAFIDVTLMNLETREAINFIDLGIEKYKIEEASYKRINLTNLEYNSDIKINLCDIDFCKHVNNTAYIKYIINSLSYDEYLNFDFKVITINYAMEALYNYNLKLFSKKEDNNYTYLIKNNDDIICKINIER